MQDIILINKPSGITSFDVIRILRKNLGIRKMGHAGTLDPMAEGLMIIGIESGTKKLSQFLKLPKVYEAEVLLGVKTDTGDLEGKILEQKSVARNDFKEEVMEKLKGKLNLPVPAYSAIKRGGEALYKKARRGESVDVPVKEMEVRDIILNNIEESDRNIILNITFDVSSGTYIRSLAEEIGRQLKVPATLKSLKRISIGEYKIEDAEDV